MQRKKTILGAVLATSLLVLGTAQAQVHHPYGDRDHDGIANRYDRDRDGDGIRNRNDPNPNRYNAPRYHRVDRYGPYGDLDRDGIQNRYDRDRDGDRVANHRDRFPNDPRRS